MGVEQRREGRGPPPGKVRTFEHGRTIADQRGGQFGRKTGMSHPVTSTPSKPWTCAW
jgi:hypothetical protein